jgi:phage shock protein A
MSPEDARSYVVSLTTHLKKTETDLVACGEELATWQGRVALAGQKGMDELLTQATARVAELNARKSALESEVGEFRVGIAKLKKDLLLLPLTQRTVSTLALQESLDQLTGGHDAVSPAVKGWQADDALAALKRKISG